MPTIVRDIQNGVLHSNCQLHAESRTTLPIYGGERGYLLYVKCENAARVILNKILFRVNERPRLAVVASARFLVVGDASDAARRYEIGRIRGSTSRLLERSVSAPEVRLRHGDGGRLLSAALTRPPSWSTAGGAAEPRASERQVASPWRPGRR